MDGGALDGLRVLELGESAASGYGGRLLADLGAEVTKVERPGVGDPSRHDGPFPDDVPDPERSGVFLYLNGGKRSLTLDLETDEGLEQLARVAALADVALVSSRPDIGFAERVSADLLQSRNPDLIVATVTPYGLTGPYREWKGYDINAGALGGISGYLGGTGRPLLIPPGSIGELQAGLNAVIAILVAVVAEISGQRIDLSESDCWAMLQNGIGIVEFVFGGRLFSRRGSAVNSGPYPNAMFHCKDGVVRVIAMQRLEWERFVGVMGNPEWAKDPRFQDRIKMNELYSDELDAHLEEWMADKSAQEIFDLCREAGVPCAPLYTIEQLVKHPELGELFDSVDHPELADVVQPTFPYRMTASEPLSQGGAPRLGEHTEEVLAEAGVR